MAKTISLSKRSRKSSPDATAPTPSAAQLNAPRPVTLDQDEVLKAMMAARKGKGRDLTSADADEESGSESDDGSGSGEDELRDDNDLASESDDDNACAASSSSGPRRGIKRSRSGSASSRSSSPLSTAPLSRIPATSSRVKAAAQAAPAKPKSSNPFDTPKVRDATFAGLGLSQPLIRALATINIAKPTEIQSACVGPILDGERYPHFLAWS